MTGVNFKGRLGNQLFQYIFLKYLQSRSKGEFIFFTNPHHAYLTKYFELDRFQDRTLGSKMYSIVTRLAERLLPFKNIYVQNFVKPKHQESKNLMIYNGYFQTDWYLNQLEEKPVIKIKDAFVKTFEDLYGPIFRHEKTIAVHIRRTDYLSYGKRDISLPIEYFQRQLMGIDDLDSYKVFFVSDDVEFVKAAFEERPNFIFSSNDEITDFQIIQNADIAIISNSSFGWWAAYLNTKGGVVHAPENWLGFRIGAEHPKGIMTSKFTWKKVLVSQEPGRPYVDALLKN